MPRAEAHTELDPSEIAGTNVPALSQVYLVCRTEERLQVLPLTEGQSAVVGRTPESDFYVDSPRVSRNHARFSMQDGRLTVEDLGSRNGTKVRGHVMRSARADLAGGDVVRIGPLDIVVACADRVLDQPRPDDEPPPSRDPAKSSAIPADGIVVADPAMVRLFQVASRLAATTSTVLIVGETGSGKEVAAEQIHRLSPRSHAPYVRLNCASLPEALLESELFGHEKGAFTGADKARIGYFQAADGGTILLDEIGEMPLTLQAKLLRVLEQRRVLRVGGREEIPIDVRIVCATHRDLERDVASGRFRQDLYYRISTFTLEVPPLRDRPTEVLLLADSFARRFAAELDLPPPVLKPQVTARLLTHNWPGNVRELRNAMEHAVVMADRQAIGVEHLPRSLRPEAAVSLPPIKDKLSEVERDALIAALTAENQNQTRAAKRLGMSRRALIYKMIKYGLRG